MLIFESVWDDIYIYMHMEWKIELKQMQLSHQKQNVTHHNL